MDRRENMKLTVRHIMAIADFTGLDLVEYIAKKLEEDDVRVYDHNIVRYLRGMSHDELTKLLNNYDVKWTGEKI